MLPSILLVIALVLLLLGRNQSQQLFTLLGMFFLACGALLFARNLLYQSGPMAKAGPTAHSNAMAEVLATEIRERERDGIIVVLQHPAYATAESRDGRAQREGLERGLGSGQSPVYVPWAKEATTEIGDIEYGRPLLEIVDETAGEVVAILSFSPLCRGVDPAELAILPPVYCYENSWEPQFQDLLSEDGVIAVAAARKGVPPGKLPRKMRAVFDARFELHLAE